MNETEIKSLLELIVVVNNIDSNIAKMNESLSYIHLNLRETQQYRTKLLSSFSEAIANLDSDSLEQLASYPEFIKIKQKLPTD